MPGEVVDGDGLILGFGLPVGGAPLGVGALEGEVGDVGGGRAPGVVCSGLVGLVCPGLVCPGLVWLGFVCPGFV